MGGELVVVADTNFIGGDGVVFVGDGEDVSFLQVVERVSGVEKALASGEPGVGQQHLRYRDVVRGEGGGPALHQQRLTSGGGRLLLPQLKRPCFKPKHR